MKSEKALREELKDVCEILRLKMDRNDRNDWEQWASRRDCLEWVLEDGVRLERVGTGRLLLLEMLKELGNR